MQKFCDLCGGIPSLADNTIRHDPNCPNHPDVIDDTPQPEPAASNVASFALARSNKGQYPNEVPAMAALDLAREWVRESGIAPDHVIVFLARAQPDGADGIKFFQSGSYRPHAQTGMIHAGLDMMHGSGFAGYAE